MNTIIKNGLIYDGSGDPPFRGEIIISGGTIINVIRDEDRRAADAPEPVAADSITIDAAGKVVTPGFIDIHRHCDIAAFRNSGNNNLAPDNRRQGDMYFGEIELAQGITTTFVGNCGLAPVPSVPQHQNELYGYLDPVTGSMPPGMHFEQIGRAHV